MHLFQIEEIIFQPITVIAEDFDHAAQIFMHSLITGLHNRPDVEFEVSKWLPKPRYQHDFPWNWVREGQAGILWRVDDDAAWELAGTDLIRE